MKKNLQDDQWAKELRDWEDAPSSEAWDRPSAGMWEHIAKDLPPKKSKKIGFWWRSALLVLVAASVALAVYFVLPQEVGEAVQSAEGIPVVGVQGLNSNSNSNSKTSSNSNSKTSSNSNSNSKTKNKEILVSTNGENIDIQTIETAIIPLGSTPVSISDNSTVNNEVPVSTDGEIEADQTTETAITELGSTPVSISDNSTINNEVPVSTDGEIEDVQITETAIIPLGSTPVSISDNSTINNEILVSTDGQAIADQTTETDIAEVTSTPVSISNNYSSNIKIPTLSLTVDELKRSLETAPVLSEFVHSPWSVDLFVLGNLEAQQRFRSPLIRSNKEQSSVYGIQLNRKLATRFSVHVGVQKSTNIVTGTARFVRFFDRNNETTDGEKKVSEFNLTTDFGDGGRVDDNLKIERDNSEDVVDQTRLLLEVKRRFILKTYSVPLQLSYSLWTQYPFRLSGLVGAKFSRTEELIENAGVTVLNAQFRVRQFNAGRPVLMRTETSSSVDLQAGLRLDVHLSPKLSAMGQFDYQGQSTKQSGLFLNAGGSQVRLGLSYGF